MDFEITRFESPYMPLTSSLSDLTSFSGERKSRLESLAFRATHIPRAIVYEIVKHAGQGQYCFIAFAGKEDLPIGFAACAIVRTGRDDWGFVTDLVVDHQYRQKKVATRLVVEMTRRLREPAVLSLAGIQEGKLPFLRVAIQPDLPVCQKIFEGCDFELVRILGERIYEYSLIPDSDDEPISLPQWK